MLGAGYHAHIGIPMDLDILLQGETGLPLKLAGVQDVILSFQLLLPFVVAGVL